MRITEQLWVLKQIYSNSNSHYDTKNKLNLYNVPAAIPIHDIEKLSQYNRLPNQIVFFQHDEVLKELVCLTEKWTIPEAAKAFVAGLWSAPFLWQSALTAKLISLGMPTHEHLPYSSTCAVCKVCGYGNGAVDATLMWYFCMVEGTPLDGEPIGHVCALREMEQLGQRPVPTEYDIWTFRAILTVIRSLPPKTRYSKARDELHRAKLLPTSSKGAYVSLLETLALIGILDTEEYPGMATQFTTYQKRDERPSPRVEPQAPLAWWNSTIGINETVVKHIFPFIDCTSVSLNQRPLAAPPIIQTVTGDLEQRRMPRQVTFKSPDAGKGPVQPGDVYAVRVREDAWVTVYCHRIEETRVVIEYLDGFFSEMPSKSQIRNTVRLRGSGRWQMKATSMDRTTGVRRVARNIETPLTDLPEPDRIPYGGAKELKYLAHWCFLELE